ncbi:MAG: type I restriction-modification system subunit M N-terminal domain-containing protein [Nitrosospira sp.]
MNQQALSSFIWSVADRLRDDFKQSEYGKVILGHARRSFKGQGKGCTGRLWHRQGQR